MKTRLLVSFISIILICFFAGQALSETPGKTRVGVIGPLTGPVALVGESVKASLLLAREKSPLLSDIEFVFEDDQFLAKNGLAAAEKLIHQDKVQALIVFGSGTGLAIGSIVDANQIPTIVMAYSEKVFNGRKFVRRFFNTAAQSAKTTAAELRKREILSLAMVTTANETTVAVRDEFLKAWKGQPPSITDINPADTDLKTIALKIKAQDPQAVYIISGPPQLSLLPIALRQVGYRGQFITPSYGRNGAAITAAKGALEGALVVATFSDALSNLMEQCRQRFGSNVAEDGLIAYDLGLFLASGLKAGNILEYLDTRDTLQGEVLTWEKQDPFTFSPPLSLGHVAGDKVTGN